MISVIYLEINATLYLLCEKSSQKCIPEGSHHCDVQLKLHYNQHIETVLLLFFLELFVLIASM